MKYRPVFLNIKNVGSLQDQDTDILVLNLGIYTAKIA